MPTGAATADKIQGFRIEAFQPLDHIRLISKHLQAPSSHADGLVFMLTV